MARGEVPTAPPTVRDLDVKAEVRKAWGKDWAKADPAYEFSGGRKFEDRGAQGGPYTGTSGN